MLMVSFSVYDDSEMLVFYFKTINRFNDYFWDHK